MKFKNYLKVIAFKILLIITTSIVKKINRGISNEMLSILLSTKSEKRMSLNSMPKNDALKTILNT